MAVHQLIPSFVAGDATGQAALHLQRLLRRMGHAAEFVRLRPEARLLLVAAYRSAHFAFLAELVVEVTGNAGLRQRLLQGQARHLAHFSAENSQGTLSTRAPCSRHSTRRGA